MNVIRNDRFKQLWARKQYKEALREPLEGKPPGADPLRSFLFGNREELQQTAAVGTASVGEFLYDYLRLNPMVAEGIDFARSDDLSSLFAFSQFAKTVDTSVDTGDIAQMQGYVAERMVAAELQARGHEVEFPDTSNNAGWDLLVDGEPFQVKNLGSPQGVYEHLEKYPDIPVYVNEELAGSFADNPMVYATSVSHAEVVENTKQTLQIGADMTDFEIPWISAMVSTGFNVRKLLHDELKLREAVLHVLSDTASRAVLGAAGQYAGSAVGLVLFGPAGALVGSGVGAFLGVGQGGKVSARIKGLLARKEEDDIIGHASALAEKVGGAIDHKLRIRNGKVKAIQENLDRSGPGESIVEVMGQLHEKDLNYLKNKRRELEALSDAIRRRELALAEGIPLLMEKTAQSGVHPVHYQREMSRLFALLQAFSRKVR